MREALSSNFRSRTTLIEGIGVHATNLTRNPPLGLDFLEQVLSFGEPPPGAPT